VQVVVEEEGCGVVEGEVEDDVGDVDRVPLAQAGLELRHRFCRVVVEGVEVADALAVEEGRVIFRWNLIMRGERMRIERRLKYALPHVAVCVEETRAQKGEHDLSELGTFLKVLGFLG
jgi:hypothetical protein